MTERASILLAIPELGSGGPDRVFHELLCGLDRAAFRPLLLVSRLGGRYFDALPQDVLAYAISGGSYPVWSFARAVDRLRPDLIVTTLRMNVTAAAARRLQRHRPPLVTRQANAIATNFADLGRRSRLKYGLAAWAVKRMLRVSDALVAQSPEMASELARHASARQKIAVIGNPVSVEDLAADCATQQGTVARERFGDPALVAVGRLAPQKGFDLLVRALASLRRVHPRAGLTILGEGPDRRELECEAARLGVAGALRLPGHTDKVLAELAAADVFVSSSRYEGFSNAILEAMALGKPVVATNCEGGTRDMVIDGRTGILADSISAEALAEAIMRCLRSDFSALGAAAREHVRSKFSRSRVIGEYASLFQHLLADRTGCRNG